VATFVVRVVATDTGAVRGQIEHVRTGEKSAFSSGEQLLAILRQMNATDCRLFLEVDEETTAPTPEERCGDDPGACRKRT
jgi:hypothetical protein